MDIWTTQALRYVAMSLRVPLSRAYGVATFYHFFTLKPAGEHTCVICMGTACYIKGAPQLLDAVQRDLGVSPGETTADKKVSLLTARCLGSCGLAPAVVYDQEVAGKVDAAGGARAPGEMEQRMTPEELEQIAEAERERQSQIHTESQRMRGCRMSFLPEPVGKDALDQEVARTRY